MSLTEHIEHRTNGRPFSIHHTDVPAGCYSALYLHCHMELELFYLEKGEIYLYIEDSRFHIHEGDAIYIPGGLTHYGVRVHDDTSQCSFDALVFSTDMIMDTIPSYLDQYIDPVICKSPSGICHLTEDSGWQTDTIRSIRKVFDYYDVPVSECELSIRGCLLNAWQLMYNNIFVDIIKSKGESQVHPLINKCIETINKNYMYEHSLKDLADTAGLSEGHFCRLFKDITGFSAFNYINRVRITKACDMLIHTDKKITEISADCGFNNISFFNRTFRNIMKESPSVYRKNFRNTTAN